MTTISRRRFIAIAATAVSMPRVALARPVATWQGTAMGAHAQMQLVGLDATAAGELFKRVEYEIDRLEHIFSLFRGDSALARLNRTGRLDTPPPELLELLSLTTAIHRATGGAFDPSVQPLWRLHASAADRGGLPLPDIVDTACKLVGWQNVRFDERAVRLPLSGMELTFNGIAQGYLADRVATMLRREGLTDILVDMGEIVASGNRPGGGSWRAGIVAPGRPDLLSRIDLKDRALATSAPQGTTLGVNGASHILDPRSGKPGGIWGLVSVSANRAAIADGLSTAFCLLNENEIAAALNVFPDARVEYLGDVA